jgi:hypothetical protein
MLHFLCNLSIILWNNNYGGLEFHAKKKSVVNVTAVSHGHE